MRLLSRVQAQRRREERKRRRAAEEAEKAIADAARTAKEASEAKAAAAKRARRSSDVKSEVRLLRAFRQPTSCSARCGVEAATLLATSIQCSTR